MEMDKSNKSSHWYDKILDFEVPQYIFSSEDQEEFRFDNFDCETLQFSKIVLADES